MAEEAGLIDFERGRKEEIAAFSIMIHNAQDHLSDPFYANQAPFERY